MPDPTAPDVDAALARLGETANRIADERNIFLAALRSVRVYVQDCIENGHDRTMLGNMYGARDEIDAAIRNVTGG
jgi:hypothetical protein